MAVVDLNTGEYVDVQSGLLQKFGPDKGRAARWGEFADTSSGVHCVKGMVALASLPTAASGNKQIVDDTVTIPNGAFIERVIVLATKETTGVNANFNLGLVDQDRSTEIDFDGFLAAADAFNGGTDLGTITDFTVGTTEVGALVGTKITNTGLIVAWPDTADFTAGVLDIRIYFSMPLAADL